MQISAFYKSPITGKEAECVLHVEGGAAEWRHAESSQRVQGSPQWRDNQLASLDWFAAVYRDMGARFVLR